MGTASKGLSLCFPLLVFILLRILPVINPEIILKIETYNGR